MLGTFTRRPAILIVALALAVATAAAAAEKVVVTVGGSASSDGDITFLFKPEQGEEQTVTVTVLKGTGSSNTAREVRKEFVLALDENFYDVEIVGKEKKKVAITSKSPSGVFDLELQGNTVGGISISLK